MTSSGAPRVGDGDDVRPRGEPWLSPWDAAELAQRGPWGDGLWGGIDPRQVRYGTPISQLASEHLFLGDVLEAAAVAGHTSAITEGVAMTLRASHAYALAQSRECELRFVLGDALGWLNADHYRDFIILLEELSIALEERAARLGAKTLNQLEPRFRVRAAAEAEACAARVERSRDRAASVRRDNHSGVYRS
jgi:hypothetical protein